MFQFAVFVLPFFYFDFHLGAFVYMKWGLTNALYVCMYVHQHIKIKPVNMHEVFLWLVYGLFHLETVQFHNSSQLYFVVSEVTNCIVNETAVEDIQSLAGSNCYDGFIVTGTACPVRLTNSTFDLLWKSLFSFEAPASKRLLENVSHSLSRNITSFYVTFPSSFFLSPLFLTKK